MFYVHERLSAVRCWILNAVFDRSRGKSCLFALFYIHYKLIVSHFDFPSHFINIQQYYLNNDNNQHNTKQLVDQIVRVKCLGGRELRGALRGYDELVNLVLDECEEFVRDSDDPERVTSETRKLGLVVIRGTQVSLVSPEEGTEEIANPFLGGADDEEE